ncbi:MAG: tyrosine-type recombinase/integrase [Clostridia bacterium]|nr:tyrosine-type recombinase/integrase [Clostridia bacterium]
MKELLKDYKLYLEKQKLSENTENSYMRDLSAFFENIGAKSKRDVLKVNAETIDAYIDFMKGRGKANSTISRSIASLKKFYQYQFNSDNITSNPLLKVDVPRVEKKVPESMTTREINKLLNQPKCIDLKGYRDKAMLELLYATGIKVSELINLNVRDVDIHGEMLRCSGKKNQRYIPIGRTAAEALDSYLKKARSLMVGSGKVKSLFVNCSGTPLTRQGFWKILRGYAEKAGIKTEINAQTLRNSFAVHMLQNGADISIVSEMLGHGDVVTTRVYSKVVNDNIKKMYRKAHPRA